MLLCVSYTSIKQIHKVTKQGGYFREALWWEMITGNLTLRIYRHTKQHRTVT